MIKRFSWGIKNLQITYKPRLCVFSCYNNPLRKVFFSWKCSMIRSMEHIIVRIIGFNQAELFLGFPLHIHPGSRLCFSSLRFLTLKSKSLAGWRKFRTKTIHKLCSIKLENRKMPFSPLVLVVGSGAAKQEAYELNRHRLPPWREQKNVYETQIVVRGKSLKQISSAYMLYSNCKAKKKERRANPIESNEEWKIIWKLHYTPAKICCASRSFDSRWIMCCMHFLQINTIQNKSQFQLPISGSWGVRKLWDLVGLGGGNS